MASRRRFEFADGTSSKFWEIELDGSAYTLRWGRIGTGGRSLTKSFADAKMASAEADKLVREKVGKGYTQIGHEKAAHEKVAAPKGPMTETVFWSLIATLDWKKTGDDDAVIRPVVSALAAMPADDIFAFDDMLAKKLYELDTRAICRGTYRGELDPDDGDDYISADDFLYSRCVIVANGKAFFEKCLAKPNSVPQEMEFEALLGVARSAYEAKTGAEYDHLTPVSWESFSNREGWAKTKATKPGKFTGKDVPPGNRRPT